MTAVYNGATYYVDFYGKKFEKEVIKLQKEIDDIKTDVLNKEEAKGLQMKTTSSEVASSELLDDRQRTPVTVSDVIS